MSEVDVKSSCADAQECNPLVTLSARLEEAIPITPEAQLEAAIEHCDGIEVDIVSSKFKHTLDPAPYYRVLSIVCFDPCDPSHFRGGGGGKAVGMSVKKCSPITGNWQCDNSLKDSQMESFRTDKGILDPSSHPNNHIYQRKGFLRKSTVSTSRFVDSIVISTGDPTISSSTLTDR